MTRPRKRYVVAFAATILAVAAVWAILRYTSVVADQVARAFTENLLADRGYRLRVGGVEGNPFRHLSFQNVHLIAQRGQDVEVAMAEELRVSFDALKLARGQIEVEALSLHRPLIRFGERGVQADLWAGDANKSQGAPTPPISVRRFQLQDARFVWRQGGQLHRAAEVNWRLRVEAKGDRLEVDIHSLSAKFLTDSLQVNHLVGQTAWAADTLWLQDLHIETAGSKADIAGWFHPASGDTRLSGSADSLALHEVEHLVELPAAGHVHGPLQIQNRNSKLEITTIYSGEFETYDIEAARLHLVSAPSLLQLECSDGRFEGAPFDLNLRMQGESLAGEASFRGLDVQRALQDPDFPSAEATGQVTFERDHLDSALALEVGLQGSRFDRWPFLTLESSILYDHEHIEIVDCQVEFPTARLEARGTLQQQDMDFDYTLQVDESAALVQPLGIEGFASQAQLRGNLLGQPDRWTLRGRARFQDLRYLDVHSTYSEADFEVRSENQKIVSNAEVRGDSVRFKNNRFENVVFDLGLAGDELSIDRFEATSGDTMVAGIARWRPETFDWRGERIDTQRLDIETMLLRMGWQEVRIEEPATIRWTDQAVRLDSLRLVTRGGGMRLDGNVDFEAATIDARAEIQRFDLDFVKGLELLPHEIAGVGTGWLEMHGGLDRTQVDARLRLLDGHWNSLPFDSVSVDVQSDAFSVELRGLNLATPHGSLQVQGRLAYLPSLGRWLAGEEGSRSPEDLSRAVVEARISMEDLQLGRIWMARRLEAEDPDWMATFSSDLRVSGSVARPHVEFRGQAHDVVIESATADSLHFGVVYRDEGVHLQEFRVSGSGAQVLTEGSLAARLHLVEGFEFLRDRPIDFRVEIPASSFAIVTRLLPTLQPAPRHRSPGSVVASLEVKGTLDSPQAQGSMDLQGASFTLAGMEEIYYDTKVSGLFDGSRLQLSSLEARTGSEGILKGKGDIYFDGFSVSDYRFSLDGQKVILQSVPEMLASLSGRAEVRAVRLGSGDLVPRFEGNLKILEAKIQTEFVGSNSSSGVFESTERPDWLADVALEAPGNVWWQNSTVNMELAGNVRMIRNTAGVDVQGEVSIKRGKYGILLRDFQITRGQLDFSQHSGFMPELDVSGRHGRPGERIYVTISGRPPDQLNYRFSSDHGESHDEIEAWMFKPDRSESGNLAAATVAEQILADLDVIKAYTETFTIDAGEAVDSPARGATVPLNMNVSAGKALSDRVFLVYTQGIGSEIDQRVAIEVDIVRGLLLESSYERRNIPDNQANSGQNAFDVDLKFRYEY